MEIEDFFGVYCLCSRSDKPQYKNRCYIGFTVDPNRRIKQHNRGTQFGGAKKTSKGGPWVMTMICHGFPNKISALRFEWAWQKPRDSRILRQIPSLQSRRPREKHFDYHFRILTEMLRTPPWNRLPLTVQWLSDEFQREFPPDKPLPFHMAVRSGRIAIRKKTAAADEEILLTQSQGLVRFCDLCSRQIGNVAQELVSCLRSGCRMVSHITCLASNCLRSSPGELIPVGGSCPVCDREFLWGDVIRKQKGCSDIVEDLNNTDAIEVEEVSDEEGKFGRE